MTNGEKATALLDYLDGLDTKSAVNILHPFIDDDVLADKYDEFVEDGLIDDKQKAHRIFILTKSDERYDEIADIYQTLDLDSFIERVKILYPDLFEYNDEKEEIEGEIMAETVSYAITWEDGMDECTRIYQKF